jgi:hypothetical protein
MARWPSSKPGCCLSRRDRQLGRALRARTS